MTTAVTGVNDIDVFGGKYHNSSPMIRTISEGVTLEDIGLPFGFYNAAAIDLGNGLTGLEGRDVQKGAEYGAPDEGATKFIVVDKKGIVVPSRTLWTPHGGDTLEDERVHEMGIWLGEDGQNRDPLDQLVIKCLTRVALANGNHEPFPAVAFTTKRDMLDGKFPDTQYLEFKYDTLAPVTLDGYKLIPGKNTNPFYQLENNNFEVAFRPNGWDFSFLVGEVDLAGTVSNVRGFGIPESDQPEWMSYRAGLCCSPLWINNTEAFAIIHGLKGTLAPNPATHNKVPGSNPGVLKKIPVPSPATLKYVYALGTARLTRSRLGRYAIDNISREPLVVPDDWPDRVELHPDLRDVVYLDGAVVNDGAIEAYPQFGDTQTVKMTISSSRVQSIIEGWDRTLQFAAA